MCDRLTGTVTTASFPIRLFVTNESGYYLDISLYREVNDPRTGQVNGFEYLPVCLHFCPERSVTGSF